VGRFTVEGNKLVADDKVVYHAIPVAHLPNHIREGEDYHAWMIPTESGHDLQVQGFARNGRIVSDQLTGVAREGTGERNLRTEQFRPLASRGDHWNGVGPVSLLVLRTPEDLDEAVGQVSRMHMRKD
jgi:hypothetical protein